MRKTIQCYSLFITLFLFSSVPSYAERAPRRSRRERPLTKEQNLKKKRKTFFTIVIVGVGVMVASVWRYNEYLKRNSLSNQINYSRKTGFTREEHKVIFGALYKINKRDGGFSTNPNYVKMEKKDDILLIMLKNEEKEAVKVLIRKGADPNKKEFGSNALHMACMKSESMIEWLFGQFSKSKVEWLLDDCGIDKESKGVDDKTPFLYAVEKGNLKIAKLLKERGANINAIEKKSYAVGKGNNALHLACLHSGSVAMVKWLLDECRIDIESEGDDNKTPFLCAAEKGQLAIAKLLKKRGANIHAQDKKPNKGNGNNALHLACLHSKNAKMVEWLLDECNINIESEGKYGRTAIICATENHVAEKEQDSMVNIVKALKKRGANVNKTDNSGNNALHREVARVSGSKAMVKCLLDVCKIDIESKGQYQRTPFLLAVEKGKLAIAKELKEQGANVNAKIRERNALHLACLKSDGVDIVDMVTWLLDKNGCNLKIELRADHEMTPFLLAAYKGHLKIAKELRKRGANVYAKDDKEKNALHLACLGSNSVPMVTWLLDKTKKGCNIDIESRGQYQRTPFLLAAEQGKLAIAKELKDQGADIHARDEDGNNALVLARQHSKDEAMIKYLESLGVNS